MNISARCLKLLVLATIMYLAAPTMAIYKFFFSLNKIRWALSRFRRTSSKFTKLHGNTLISLGKGTSIPRGRGVCARIVIARGVGSRGRVLKVLTGASLNEAYYSRIAIIDN